MLPENIIETDTKAQELKEQAWALLKEAEELKAKARETFAAQMIEKGWHEVKVTGIDYGHNHYIMGCWYLFPPKCLKNPRILSRNTNRDWVYFEPNKDEETPEGEPWTPIKEGWYDLGDPGCFM